MVDTSGRRAVTFALLFVLQLATLVPCFAPSSIYLPQLVTYAPRGGALYLLGVTSAITCLVLGAIRAAHRATSSRSAVLLVSTAVTIVAVALTVASAFYSRFGAFPSFAIVREMVVAPRTVLTYVRQATVASDVLVFGGSALVCVLSAFLVTRRVWDEPRVVHRAVWNSLIGVTLGAALYMSTDGLGSARFLVTEHSLPAVKYVATLARAFDTNRVELARQYLPRPEPAAALPAGARARHVVLIVADSLRADHLGVYGYRRPTTPFIDSERSNWVIFDRAYAHGCGTSESLPILFNSQYYAAIAQSNSGATTFWRALREGGIESAFLSASALEWGGIAHTIDLDHVGVELNPADVADAPRWRPTNRRFDYAVDDGIPLRRYIELVGREWKQRPSFSAIYFVGSHYPYQYDDTPDLFVPSLRRPRGPDVGEDAELTRIANTYDNSIVHIDGLVRQTVEALERLGMADDSIVIVTSDHGESLGEHQTLYHGTSLYEEQVHVPLLIRVGANLSGVRMALEGRRTGVVGQVDLLPTVLHMLTGRPPVSPAFDGGSLLASRGKSYEVLLFRGSGEQLAIVTDRRKYLFDLTGRHAEEYDVREDPGERHNLWRGGERTIQHFTAALMERGVLPTSTTP